MDKFIVSLAKKYVSRSRKIKWLFSLMSFFIVTILVTAVSVTSTVTATIKNCEADYSTIGLVEYIGEQYPAMTQEIDTQVAAAQSAFCACLTESDTLIEYEKTGSALGYLGEAKSLFNKRAADDSAVIAATVINDSAIDGAYVALCAQEIFSTRDIQGKYINLKDEGTVFEKGHTYLLHGTFGADYYPTVLHVSPFMLADYGDIDCCVDITSGEHGAYTIPPDSLFLEMAETYKTVSQCIHVNLTDFPEDALPFHEDYISLVEGDFYTENGIILSQFAAERCGLAVGDRVTLSMSAKPNTYCRRSYSKAEGFDAEETVTLTGIFKDNSEYRAEAFASVTDGFDATMSNDSYTLGQLYLKNSGAQEYVSSLSLPSSVRVTVYDQGYKQNIDTLMTMRSLGYIVSAAAAAAALVMIFLYGYMLVYKQEKEINTMIRLGCRVGQIKQYFYLICARIAALPITLSAVGGYFAVDYLNSRLLGVLLDPDLSLYRYSNSAVSVVKKLSSLSAGSSIAVTAAVAAASFVLILVSAGLFVRFVFRRPHKQRREFHPVRGRTHGLDASGTRFAVFTCVRDFIKNGSAVVLIAAFSLLCSSLCVIAADTRSQVDEIRKNGDVRGYFTDIYGKNVFGLLIYYNDIENISSIDGVSNVTGVNTVTYEFCAAVKPDGTLIGPGAVKIPNGSFAQERLVDRLAANPKLVCTTSVYGSPEFLYSPNLGIKWLSGYGDGDFASSGNDESICVIGGKLAQEYGIELGDKVWLNVFNTTAKKMTLACMNDELFKVVGIYEDDGLASSIYTPSDFLHFTGAPVTDTTPMTTVVLDGCEVHDGLNLIVYGFPTFSGATFTVDDCSKLDSIKNALASFGYSCVNSAGRIRRFVEINDASYLSFEQSMTQKLWCINYLFPVIYAACVVLCFVAARVNMRGRQGDIRIMHNLGTPRRVMLRSIMLSQLIQVAAGAMLGAGLMLIFRRCGAFALEMLAACAVSYLVGAAAAYRRISNIDRKHAGRTL